MSRVRETAARLGGRVDPLGPLLALVAVGVFVAHGFHGHLYRDAAVYAYGAQQVVEGVPPYVSILNRAGPLAHLVPAIGVWFADLVDIDDVIGIRLVMTAVSVVCVWALYLAGRDIFRSRLAGIVAASTLLTFEGFVAHATAGPREKTTMMLFLVLALWCISRRRWGLAGAAVALSTLAWQPVFFVGVVATLVGIAALRGRAILRALLAFAIGGIVPTALCVLGFWMAGALQELLDGFVLINARYTYQEGLLHWLATLGLSHLLEGFGWSLWLILAGLVAIVVAASLAVPRAVRDREAADVAVVATGAAALAGIGWSLRAFNGWADTAVLLPMAALGVGAVAAAVAHRLPQRIGVRVVAVWTVVTLVAAFASSLDNRDDRLVLERRAVNGILAAGPPDATLMSVGAPQALVLSGRTNPAQHQNFQAGLAAYVDDTYPGGLAGFADFIGEQEQPTFLTLDDTRFYPWLRDTLERDYVRVGGTFGFIWFVRGDVGAETVDRLRETIRSYRDAARRARGMAVK